MGKRSSESGRKNLPRSPLVKSYSGFICVPRSRGLPPWLVFWRKSAELVPVTGQPLESVDQECVLATGIPSQRNPSDLGVAVLIVRDRNRKRVQEYGCGAL